MHSIKADKIQYHIACKKGDLAEYLLVPGDPDRVPKIVKFWDSAREVSCHREFRSITGKYKGVSISALSSGIGPACMAIVVNEASAIGVHTFIRVGSTGAIQKNSMWRLDYFCSSCSPRRNKQLLYNARISSRGQLRSPAGAY